MYRFISVVALVSLLCGCASISDSSPLKVAPPSAKPAQWTITARAETGIWFDNLTLYVNGAKVATGSMSAGNHKGIHIAGEYQHHIVLGICSRNSGIPDLVYTCNISVDAYKVGSLRF